jgi:hypothetical protein
MRDLRISHSSHVNNVKNMRRLLVSRYQDIGQFFQNLLHVKRRCHVFPYISGQDTEFSTERFTVSSTDVFSHKKC